MVNVEDKDLRINRLSMLEKLRELFLRVAGGGQACNTGKSGVCTAGVTTCTAGQLGCARSMPMCVPPAAGPVGDSPRCGRCDTGRIGAGRCDRTPGPGSPSVPR